MIWAKRIFKTLVGLILAAPFIVVLGVSVNEKKTLTFPPQGFSLEWFGQIVLDPSLGSGSTAVAALRTGRRCIGIDKEEAYLEISRHRAAEEAGRAAASSPIEP